MTYKIVKNGTTFASSDPLISDFVVASPKLDLKINEPGSLIFTKPSEMDFTKTDIIEVIQDTDTIFRGRVLDFSIGFNKTTKVTCEGQMTFFRDSVQGQQVLSGVSCKNALTQMLATHNAQVESSKQFTLGNVTVNKTVDMVLNYGTTYEAMKEIVEQCGGLYKFRKSGSTWYVDYMPESESQLISQTVDFGKNLLDFTKNKNLGEIYSAVIPLGAKLEQQDVEGIEKRLTVKSVNNNGEIIQSDSLVSQYGRIVKSIVYDNIADATNLKQVATAELLNQFSDITLSAKILDLHLLNPELPAIHIGDRIRVVSKPHNLDKIFLVAQISIPMDNPAGGSVTLGADVKAKLTSEVLKISSAAIKAMNSNVTRGGITWQAQQMANKMFSVDGSGSYVIFQTDSNDVVQQILVMDAPKIENATKILKINKNGVAGSEDGGNTYSTALTTDGWIYGQRVIAGSISTDQLAAGSIIADKIQANQITAAKIVDGSVTESKIGSSAVTTGKISSGAVTSGKIGSSAVTTEKIADLAVTNAKIDSINANKITAGTINANILYSSISNMNVLHANGITCANAAYGWYGGVHELENGIRVPSLVYVG